jgi:hypothetical protein
MAADVETLIGATEALKLQVHDLYRAIYTTGRATEPSPAPPHLDLFLIGVAGQARGAETLLADVETALKDMRDGNFILPANGDSPH